MDLTDHMTYSLLHNKHSKAFFEICKGIWESPQLDRFKSYSLNRYIDTRTDTQTDTQADSAEIITYQHTRMVKTFVELNRVTVANHVGNSNVNSKQKYICNWETLTSDVLTTKVRSKKNSGDQNSDLFVNSSYFMSRRNNKMLCKCQDSK